MTALALTVDATTISVARVDPDGAVHDTRQQPTPTTSVWQACRRLLLEAAGPDPVNSVAICTAGPIDMAAGIAAPAQLTDWAAGFDIVTATRELFPDATAALAAEGVCLALAEQRYGHARTVMDAMAITVSTHLTGGLIVGGFVLVGHTGNTGNIGHMVIAGHHDPCPCGAHGCLQTIASTTATMHWAHTHGLTATTPADLIDAAHTGHPTATAALQRAGTALGQAISSAAALLDLDLVIIGGPLAQAGPPLWRPLTQAIATHARLSFLSTLRVLPTTLDTTATLSGAALLTTPTPQPA